MAPQTSSFRPLRLDDLYKMVARIYNEQNAHRPASSTFAHFIEVCGMLTIHDRQKRREEVSVEDALCKALGWYFPLLAKFKVASVEELVFHKYPAVCPYCRLNPHNDARCKNVRGTKRTVDHEALRKFYEGNKSTRPVGLNDWQRLFQEIYPRSVEDRSARSTVGLLEELGELAEAVRVFERHPQYFAGEAADVFSYLMGIANEHSLRMEQNDKTFDFEAEFLKRYPGLCVQCGYSVCICPLVPESTVGRLAKELSLESLDTLFGFRPEQFEKEGAEAATLVLNRVGGYTGIADRFPFDRGDANRALVNFCLKLAESIEEQHAEVAQRLRSAAMKAGSDPAYPGSRTKRNGMQAIVESIRAVIPDVAKRTEELVSDESLSGQIGKLLLPKIKVLLVIANPVGSAPLRLGEEDRAVREAVTLSGHRDRISIRTLNAATPDDVRRALLEDDSYDVLHLSGHGSPGVFLFESVNGGSAEATASALRDFVKRYPSIKCVILNSCFGLKGITLPIGPLTVGMEESIDDRAAIEFARGFYDAIAAGKNYDFAIEEGKSAVSLKNLDLPLIILK